MLAVAAGLGFAVLGGFFGDRHPLLDTLAHFRAHACVALLFAAIALCLVRLWAAGLAALAPACLGLVTVAPFMLPADAPPRTEETGPRYTLLQLNLRWDLEDTAPTLRLIGELAPDVVAVQEMTGEWQDAFESIRQRYPYQFFCAPPRFEGDVAILSRRPFVEGDTGVCDVLSAFAARRIDFNGVQVIVGSEHLRWPWPGEQWRQIDRVAPRLAALGDPLVIAGDFNATPWSAAIRAYAAASGTRTVPGVGPTWFVHGLSDTLARFVGLPIDQVLVSQGVNVVSVERPVGTGSDHLPVLLTFTLALGGLPEPSIQTVERTPTLRGDQQ